MWDSVPKNPGEDQGNDRTHALSSKEGKIKVPRERLNILSSKGISTAFFKTLPEEERQCAGLVIRKHTLGTLGERQHHPFPSKHGLVIVSTQMSHWLGGSALFQTVYLAITFLSPGIRVTRIWCLKISSFSHLSSHY